jgi:hypothetical protein
MHDGMTKCVDLAVDCPKCALENIVRVATGLTVDTIYKSLTCVHCGNPWNELLPGELIAGPVSKPEHLNQN